MIFGGVKITYPWLGLILYKFGLGRSQSQVCENFDLMVRSVPPLNRLIMIVPTFHAALLVQEGERDYPHSGSEWGLGKELNKSYTRTATNRCTHPEHFGGWKVLAKDISKTCTRKRQQVTALTSSESCKSCNTCDQ